MAPSPCPSLLLPFVESLMRLMVPSATTLAERGVAQSATLKTNPGASDVGADVALTTGYRSRMRAIRAPLLNRFA